MQNDSTDATETVRWRISSFSAHGECVAVAEVDHQIAVRNSNHPDAGTLHIDRASMAAWIAGIKAGEFDDLVS